MNNEQEIERMELLLVNDILSGHNAEETAQHLHKYGIGDKNQAVKEFAKNVKRKALWRNDEIYIGDDDIWCTVSEYVDSIVDEVLKELGYNE